MRFDGTILITDPCYLSHGSNDYLNEIKFKRIFPNSIYRSTIYGDWSCCTYETPKSDVVAHVNDIEDTLNKRYNAYKANETDLFESLVEKHEDLIEYDDCIGEFCADSGMVCVVYLEEALKNNPNFENGYGEDGDASIYDFCATIVEDFHGEVKELVIADQLFLIGISDSGKHFYTIQEGL